MRFRRDSNGDYSLTHSLTHSFFMNLLSGDAHARRPLHKMDGVFFLSGDAHARRPLHKMDGVFFFFRFVGQLLEHPVWRHLPLPAH